MLELIPQGSFLSVGVYSEKITETAAFAGLCHSLEACGATPAGVLDVFPEGVEFDWDYDLTSVRQQVEVPTARFREMVAGQVAGARVKQAGYRAEITGPIVVRYSGRKSDTGRHVVEALVSDGALGIPDWLWTPREKENAKKLGNWALGLLQYTCEHDNPLYGFLADEETLPVPSSLEELRSRDIFVSSRVLRADTALERELREFYGTDRITHWVTGVFCAAWDDLYLGRSFRKEMPPQSDWIGARLKRAIGHMDLR